MYLLHPALTLALTVSLQQKQVIFTVCKCLRVSIFQFLWVSMGG